MISSRIRDALPCNTDAQKKRVEHQISNSSPYTVVVQKKKHRVTLGGYSEIKITKR